MGLPPLDLGAALLLTQFGLASAKAVAFERQNLGMVGEAIDEGDGARRIGEDGVPLLEGQVGGNEHRSVLIAAADDLKEEVGGAGVVRKIADLVNGEECGSGVVAQAALEGPRGFLPVEIEE